MLHQQQHQQQNYLENAGRQQIALVLFAFLSLIIWASSRTTRYHGMWNIGDFKLWTSFMRQFLKEIWDLNNWWSIYYCDLMSSDF